MDTIITIGTKGGREREGKEERAIITALSPFINLLY